MATKSADIVVSAVTEFDGRALTKGQKQVSHFDAGVKKLAKTFASLYSVSKIAQFGKASVNAFMADDKAIKSLGVTLRNTGNSFATDYVNQFIAGTEKVSGVLDDQLRPAFQTILTATGSVTQSQKALQTALNVSAGTGRDLGAISLALAKGFNGQTTALTKLGAGLKKSTIASGDMNKIMDELNAKFRGQAATAAASYAGKMGKLTVAANNAKEAIGKGIIDALSLLGDDNSIDNTTSAMDRFGTSTANAIVGVGGLVAAIHKIPGWDKIISPIGKEIWSSITTPFRDLSNFGAKITAKANAPTSNFTYSLGTNAETEKLAIKDKKQAAKDLAAKNKLTKIENAALLAKLQLEGDAKVLAELANKFDLERIGIVKALSETTDAHTKTVLQSQLDILDGNAKAARADIASLEAQDAARKKSALDQFANDALAKLATDSLASSMDASAKVLTKAFIDLGGSASYAAAAARALGDSHPAQMTGITTNMGTANIETALADWLATRQGEQGAPVTTSTAAVQTVAVLPVIVSDAPGFTAAVQTAVTALNRVGANYAGRAEWQ